MPWEERADDPQLGAKRNQLITAAALQLAEARMIAFDRNTGSLVITDLGRIAAKYYIRHKSIEIFNERFRPKMSEADVLTMLSASTEVFYPLWYSSTCWLTSIYLVRTVAGPRE